MTLHKILLKISRLCRNQCGRKLHLTWSLEERWVDLLDKLQKSIYWKAKELLRWGFSWLILKKEKNVKNYQFDSGQCLKIGYYMERKVTVKKLIYRRYILLTPQRSWNISEKPKAFFQKPEKEKKPRHFLLFDTFE